MHDEYDGQGMDQTIGSPIGPADALSQYWAEKKYAANVANQPLNFNIREAENGWVVEQYIIEKGQRVLVCESDITMFAKVVAIINEKREERVRVNNG